MGKARATGGRAGERLLGVHVPTTGGLDQAPVYADLVGATAIQVFTRNQLQWRTRPVGRREAAAFRSALAASRVRAVLSHGSYLVNLASPRAAARRRSVDAAVSEVRRCHALGIPDVVFHPGAHLGAGVEAGLALVADSVEAVLKRTDGLGVRLLLEVTAGQGTCLGHDFEHFALVLGWLGWPARLGVCLDTCHLTAAGYDLATANGYRRTMMELNRAGGLTRVGAVHVNDAREPLGSRRDRHAPIGAGHLGLETFRRLVNDDRFRKVPMVMETPGPVEVWRREVALLRSLVG